MSDSRSISELSDKEKKDRLDSWEKWYEGNKKKVEATNTHAFGQDVMSWDEFRKKYKDETRKNFLMFRHAGGEWEQYEYQDRAGGTGKAWRYVEGNYRDPDEEEKKKGGKFKIKSNYKPGSSIPDYEPYKTKRLLESYDDDKDLTPDSEVLKPSRGKFNIPKRVINYAAGSSRPTNTARMGINKLRKEVNRKPFKKIN